MLKIWLKYNRYIVALQITVEEKKKELVNKKMVLICRPTSLYTSIYQSSFTSYKMSWPFVQIQIKYISLSSISIYFYSNTHKKSHPNKYILSEMKVRLIVVDRGMMMLRVNNNMMMVVGSLGLSILYSSKIVLFI